MLKIYKLYLKYKLESLLKDKMLFHLEEKDNYNLRAEEWKLKKYDDKSFISEERFEQERKQQITFSYESWKENHYRLKTISEILEIIK